jgi:hypothetical protein
MLTRQEIFRGCTAGFASVCYDYIKQTKKREIQYGKEERSAMQCKRGKERMDWMEIV